MPNTRPMLSQGNIQRQNLLLDATIRDFSGGWNVVDNELNLDTKFSKILENMQRGIDGSQTVRPGTSLFAETSTFLDVIINCEYFNNHIIAVGGNGKIVRIDADGNVILIWDDAFASTLLGAPTGWTTTTFVSFAIFNGELIICNGINKPLIINTNMTVIYLKDLADNSNAFVPIARFVVAHGRYLVMAGSLTAGLQDRLFISNTDTSGTFVGASSPNDSITLDLGSRVPSGSDIIKGLGRFRDLIMVMFENAILPGILGVFDAGTHSPTFTDAFENVGALSHRIIQTVGEDMLFGDISGVASVQRALFTGNVTSSRISQLIDPDYIKSVGKLNSVAAFEDRVWSLWDSRSFNYMLFVPNADGISNTTETRCFVHKRNKKLKLDSWQDWRNWNFRSGCRSALKRIFLTEGTQVFILGEETDNQIYKDYEGDQEMWDDDQPWTDYTGWNPVADVKDSGVPIKFIWELPWADNDTRFLVKNSRYINFDTDGDNVFTVEMFTDNNYLNRTDKGEDWVEDSLRFDDGLGFDVDVLDPTLSITFEGGAAPGFGADEFGIKFGGGRPTRLEKLYAWTSKYKIQKLRMFGDGIDKLKFVSITLAYLIGSPRR